MDCVNTRGMPFETTGAQPAMDSRAATRARRHIASRRTQSLRTLARLVLAMTVLACGNDGPTAPRELAARYTLVQHGGRALPVLVGTLVQRPPGETQGPGVTCTQELLATDLHFWSTGSGYEVGWQDSTRIECPDGSPVQYYRPMILGPTDQPGEMFRLRLYYGFDPLLYSVVYLRRTADTLTVYRREEWRIATRVEVDQTLLVFVPAR
jgi:hypothetical protein